MVGVMARNSLCVKETDVSHSTSDDAVAEIKFQYFVLCTFYLTCISFTSVNSHKLIFLSSVS